MLGLALEQDGWELAAHAVAASSFPANEAERLRPLLDRDPGLVRAARAEQGRMVRLVETMSMLDQVRFGAAMGSVEPYTAAVISLPIDAPADEVVFALRDGSGPLTSGIPQISATAAREDAELHAEAAEGLLAAMVSR